MKIYKLPHPADTRYPTGPDDWGDILTIGLHLKSRDPKSEPRFGIYLGLNKVGIKTVTSFDIVDIIEYKTDEEMHAYWVLD